MQLKINLQSPRLIRRNAQIFIPIDFIIHIDFKCHDVAIFFHFHAAHEKTTNDKGPGRKEYSERERERKREREEEEEREGV